MLSSKCSGGRLDAAWLTSLMGAVKARGRAAQARKSWLPASLVVVTEALERGGAGDVALPDSCQDVDVALPLVVVRRGFDYSYSYRGRVLRNTGCIVGLRLIGAQPSKIIVLEKPEAGERVSSMTLYPVIRAGFVNLKRNLEIAKPAPNRGGSHVTQDPSSRD